MIRLGIIGTNFVSDWLCESIERTEGIANHAVYSRAQETGNAFAAKHKIPHVYTDMEAFLSSDIDAVYIASPNRLHYPQTMAAIAHGKHVLCEKSIALSYKELAEMIHAAKEHNVVLLEAMRPAFDPAIAAVKECMEKLGKIRYARMEYCQYSSRYDRFKNGEVLNAFRPELGNAALMDIGVYAVHCLALLFDCPDLSAITACSTKLSNGFEGMGNVLLPYGDFTAQLLYSKITDSTQPSIIMGENGTVTINKLSTTDQVILQLRGCPAQEIIYERRENNMEFETEEFVRLIRAGLSDHPHLHYSEVTLQIMDKIRELNNIQFE